MDIQELINTSVNNYGPGVMCKNKSGDRIAEAYHEMDKYYGFTVFVTGELGVHESHERHKTVESLKKAMDLFEADASNWVVRNKEVLHQLHGNNP